MRKGVWCVLLLVTLLLVSLGSGAVQWEWFGTGIRCEITELRDTVLHLPLDVLDVVGRVCWVFLWHNLGQIGAFENSFLPVWYAEDGSGAWIGGPTINFAGGSHSGGQGTNGDDVSEVILGGGQLANGASIQLVDDSADELAGRGQWTVKAYWPEDEEPPVDPRIVVIVQVVL